jgi:hypothetical protein
MSHRHMITRFFPHLIVAIMCSIEIREASADTRVTNPDVKFNTVELLSYQDPGYRFKIIPMGATPPAGFEQPTFDDSAFEQGLAAFGSGGQGGVGEGRDCPLQRTVETNWPNETQLLVRRVVVIPPGAVNIRIMVSVDNDIIGAFFNGTRIGQNIAHRNCPVWMNSGWMCHRR